LLSKPTRKKEVVTPEIIQSLFSTFGHSNASLADIRILTISVLCYAGFLRFDELIQLRRCDFFIEEAYMRIFIERSKTDIYRDGAWVIIARTGLHTCPVSLTLRYFTLGGISPYSDEYIFRSLSYCSSTGNYKLRGISPLSYTRTREIILGAFEKIGHPKKEFGLHSFRAGGASAAANSNISARLFIRHGRWMSDKAKDGYIKDNLDGLLSVSKALGI
jgi:integrase